MSTPPSAARDFDRAGGEAVLRPVVDRFVRRMANDFVIGFFFPNPVSAAASCALRASTGSLLSART